MAFGYYPTAWSIGWEASLPASRRLVLLALCDFANADTAIAFPSQALLAELTGLNERTVGRALKDLEGVHGLIRRQRRTDRRNAHTIQLRFAQSKRTKLPDLPDRESATFSSGLPDSVPGTESGTSIHEANSPTLSTDLPGTESAEASHEPVSNERHSGKSFRRGGGTSKVDGGCAQDGKRKPRGDPPPLPDPDPVRDENWLRIEALVERDADLEWVNRDDA